MHKTKLECICKNCKFVITDYTNTSHHTHSHTNTIRKYKSGILLHNISSNHILIVQSRGNMWGFPKGSLEEGENFNDCAIRELREETGINLESDVLDTSVPYRLNHYVKYYYITTEEDYSDIGIHDDINNDANGICWIKLSCLKDLLVNDKIIFNYHARNCLYHYFKISKNNI